MNIVLTDFYATWCGPCKMQDSIINELKKKYKDKVVFKKINVDSRKKYDKELTKKHNITGVPTIIIENDEKIVRKHVGLTGKASLEEDIEKILKSIVTET